MLDRCRDDFIAAIRQKVDTSDVLLVLIGPRWLTAADEEGRWRLADENDLVRLEIVSALNRNIRVIPVLLQGATMPRSKDLPAELAKLAQRNAFEIRDTHFDQDLAQLAVEANFKCSLSHSDSFLSILDCLTPIDVSEADWETIWRSLAGARMLRATAGAAFATFVTCAATWPGRRPISRRATKRKTTR